jgi:hypothetical protein
VGETTPLRTRQGEKVAAVGGSSDSSSSSGSSGSSGGSGSSVVVSGDGKSSSSGVKRVVRLGGG